MITIIVATTTDRAIGLNGDLLYHIREDLRHFKELTMGHTIIMGRKTFESLPKGALPGRRNIVISRQPDYVAPGAEVVPSVEHALAIAGNQAFVIGGESIYRASLPLADRICLTLIDAKRPDADTFFPELGPEWIARSQSETKQDPASGVDFQFIEYTRPTGFAGS